MDQLREKTAKWTKIRQGQEAYGTGSPFDQANAYYYDEMMEVIIAGAKARWDAEADRPKDLGVGLLVSLAGFSPATTILAYRLLKPQRLFVIASERAEASIDTIHRFVVGDKPDRLNARMFRHEECDPSQPHAIYELVKREWERTHRVAGDEQARSSVIDITGGKKVMSAAAALVAWQLDLRLCYIDSEYEPSLRQPRPGTERLILLDNPMTLYGDAELRRAIDVFKAGHFAAASYRFQELAERTGNAMARFVAELAALYGAVCDLDMDSLSSHIAKVRTHLQSARIRNHLPEHGHTYDRQLDLMEKIGQRDPALLNLCYFTLGQHYVALARYDFAVLLFYRMMEGCFRMRLESRFPGFNSRQPDYSKLTDDPTSLLRQYNEIALKISADEQEAKLPRSIGLMSAACLLAAMDDPLMRTPVLPSPKDLGRFKRLSSMRNDSVLAHGYQSVRRETCVEFQKAARAVLENFWAVHDGAAHCDGMGIDEVSSILAFQQPDL